jgi:hypothetical protein
LDLFDGRLFQSLDQQPKAYCGFKDSIGIPDRALRRGASAKVKEYDVEKGMIVGIREAKIPQPASTRGT